MGMIDKNDLYPLKFIPVYKERMWGGTQLAEVLKRDVPKLSGPVGESWELVDREDEQSIVSEGPLKGSSLNELIRMYGKDLLGDKFAGGRFPLLVKLIDADKRLSLQVHPDRAACAEIGEGAEPKTEMWYVIANRKGAKIMAGMNPRCTKRQVVETLSSPEIEKYLQVFPSVPGDAYFISAGTLHAIGGGNLLLEIQQNSDTTYRVSDWGRVDSGGKARELHVDKAMKSINFVDRTSPRISGVSDTAPHNRRFPVINRCPCFLVDDYRLVEDCPETTAPFKSFHLLSVINRPVRIAGEDKSVDLAPGDTCLVPACFGAYRIVPLESGESTVIKTTIQ